MGFDHLHYVPCLRWKQGEYQAVLRLSSGTKKLFTPLMEVPELGWDFEEKKEKKTIDQLLTPFPKRVHEKWGTLPCFVDVMKHIQYSNRTASGAHPENVIFAGLREKECLAIPAIGLERNSEHLTEIAATLAKDQRGVCFRITAEQAARGSLKTDLDYLLLKLSTVSNDCDLILDLGAPNFLPLDGFVNVISALVRGLPYLNKWRTLTVLGTSFPETMGVIKEVMEIIPRYEWQLYKKLVAILKHAGLRIPTFGDYAIAHPNIPVMDMRIIKPAATIRYTIDDNWCIVKGKSFRDDRKQYHELCKKLVTSRYFIKKGLSYGDEYIEKCSKKETGCGALSTWRQVGTNRHIVKLVQDIANFFASSKNP